MGAGVLAVTTARTSAAPVVAGARPGRLADLVAAQQSRVAALRVAARAAAGQVQALTAAAGLEPVRGPALTVTLDDAPPHAGHAPGVSASTPDDLVVHQQDVQGVVNAPWAGGAEAVTLMGRVVSTTAVRCVGSTLLLGGAVYSPPFVVTAIGPPGPLVAALAASPDVTVFREYVRAYGLRYGVRTRAAVTLPGYSGALALRYARPVAP